jgi:hypothetical protein
MAKAKLLVSRDWLKKVKQTQAREGFPRMYICYYAAAAAEQMTGAGAGAGAVCEPRAGQRVEELLRGAGDIVNRR